MKLANHKMRYGNMTEALADMRDLASSMEAMKTLADLGMACPPDVYRNTCRALALLRDERKLEDMLAKGLQADGSVEFGFTDDAWRFLAKRGVLPE